MLNLPPQPGPARDAAILDAVRKGSVVVKWAAINTEIAGHKATFTVFADALMMDGVRVNVSATLEQQIADLLSCSLLTPKLADEVWLQRKVAILPSPQPISASTQAMIDHSKRVDALIAQAGGGDGIISTVGKHWVIANGLETHKGKAENYGWHFPGSTFIGQSFEGAVTPPGRVIQGQGWAHDPSHVDYSQTCVLVQRKCKVDGVSMDIQKVLQDPELAGLASHEGVVRVLRQPGVAPLKPLRMSVSVPKYTATAVGAVAGFVVGGPVGAVAGAAFGFGVDWFRKGRAA